MCQVVKFIVRSHKLSRVIVGHHVHQHPSILSAMHPQYQASSLSILQLTLGYSHQFLQLDLEDSQRYAYDLIDWFQKPLMAYSRTAIEILMYLHAGTMSYGHRLWSHSTVRNYPVKLYPNFDYPIPCSIITQQGSDDGNYMCRSLTPITEILLVQSNASTQQC